MERKVVLVTGAGGFIGRWAVPKLIERGYTVHAVVGRAAAHPAPDEIAGAQAHWVDLFDEAAVQALLATVAPSHLLHFAWVATPGEYWHSADNHRWLHASEQLLAEFRAAGGVRAVLAGTSAEYDWSRVGVCEERSSPLADESGAVISPYAECKLALHRALERRAVDGGLSSAWGRVFFQYGPGEHPDRLVASVITRLLQRRPALYPRAPDPQLSACRRCRLRFRGVARQRRPRTGEHRRGAVDLHC
jgi:nucleoside-diphosphate-sugar epimerase